MIKAPFNFVPINENVVKVEWCDQISHDVPFSDGVSGTIDIEMEAMTDIFVRNGHTREEKDNEHDNYKSFSRTSDGRYFIPATTLKGEIRNVLEILSFGKMSRFNPLSFGIRDLKNKSYTDRIKSAEIHCGWLSRVDERYVLDDHGLPKRVTAKELDEKYGRDLFDFITTARFSGNDESNKLAKTKYDLFQGLDLTEYYYNGIECTVVFTGQPGNRNENNNTGKYREFLFPNESLGTRTVPEKVFKEFESIHKDSPDYVNFRKPQLKKEGKSIPVFFRYKSGRNGIELESMGLAYMYKIPAVSTVRDAIPVDLQDETIHDMAECLFGYTSASESLRGRVMFGHAFAESENIAEGDERAYAMSSPNPSFYPLYLGNGQTWDYAGIRIAGRKRYPVRDVLAATLPATDNMLSKCKPLPAGVKFTEKVRFHNLKKVELGALLSAITFHGHNECFHSIGAYKPLGYGKVKFRIKSLEIREEGNAKDVSYYLDCFSAWMQKRVSGWENSSQLKELFAMAKGIPAGRENEFTYMQMSLNRKENEFVKAKNEYGKSQLGTFTQIIGNCVPECSFVKRSGTSKRFDVDAELEGRKKAKEQEIKLCKKVKELEIQLCKFFDNGYYKEALAGYEGDYGIVKLPDDYMLKYNEIVDEHRTRYMALVDAGGDQFKLGHYQEARDKFDEAKSMYEKDVSAGIDYTSVDFEARLNLCNQKLISQSFDGSNVNRSVDSFNLSSPAALANALSKLVGGFSDEDLDRIACRINELPDKKKKDWLNRSKWKPAVKSIGEDNVNKLFGKLK